MYSNPGPQAVSYLFVDGAYLTTFARNAGDLWYGEAAQIDYAVLGAGFRKVFYYDCLPARTDKESVEEFARKTSEKEDFFNSLRSINGWHVSEGLAKWKKKSGSRQKEIDISIAVDMLTHTYRKNMDQLTFVAGDQDFRPLLEAVVREGMYVTLKYGATSISRDLMHAADAKTELGIYELHGLCTANFKKRHPLPSLVARAGNGVLEQEIIEVAYRETIEVAWLSRSRFQNVGYVLTTAYLFPDAAPQMLDYESHSIDLLKKTFGFCHGAVEWKSVSIVVTVA